MNCFIYWTADFKSSKLWSSQLWTQFKQLRMEAWKSQDFNGVWGLPVTQQLLLMLFVARLQEFGKPPVAVLHVCTQMTLTLIFVRRAVCRLALWRWGSLINISRWSGDVMKRARPKSLTPYPTTTRGLRCCFRI